MYRLMNKLVGFLIRIGVPMKPRALLTVTGRISGRPRHTPIAIVPHDSGWRLLATAGIGDWVKNLRAAGTATLTFHGAHIPVSAVEFPLREAAQIMRTTMAEASPLTRRMIASNFDATADDSLSAWEKEVELHPMFYLTPLALPEARDNNILRTLTIVLAIGVALQVITAGAGAFGQPTWDLHGTMGVVTEAVALVNAIAAVALRRVGVRWLAAGIFILITFQHGTVAIGGVAGGIHSFNALLMLLLAATILRRLGRGHSVPAAPHAEVVTQPLEEQLIR